MTRAVDKAIRLAISGGWGGLGKCYNPRNPYHDFSTIQEIRTPSYQALAEGVLRGARGPGRAALDFTTSTHQNLSY